MDLLIDTLENPKPDHDVYAQSDGAYKAQFKNSSVLLMDTRELPRQVSCEPCDPGKHPGDDAPGR